MALEEFVQTGSVGPGEIVMKLPGTDFKTAYSGGDVYVSKSNRMGYVALTLTGLDAVENGEPEGIMGSLGVQLREMVTDPSVKPQLDAMIKDAQLYMFISKTTEGDVITMQGFNAGESMIGETLVAAYVAQGGFPSLEHVYAVHANATRGRTFISDRAEIETLAASLPERANELYVQGLELAKESIF
jgi:hypothetical protein